MGAKHVGHCLKHSTRQMLVIAVVLLLLLIMVAVFQSGQEFENEELILVKGPCYLHVAFEETRYFFCHYFS